MEPTPDIRKRKRDKEKNREGCRQYRLAVKNDPIRHAEEKMKAKERRRKYRETMSEETKAKIREQNRIRQQRRREKQAEKKETQKKLTEKKLTRKEHEKLKVLWRERKRAHRSKLSSQKKRRIRERDREWRREKRARMGAEDSMKTPVRPTTPAADSGSTISASFSSTAKRKAVSRARSRLPKQARKYASVISSLINNASPSKKAALRELGIDTSPPRKKRRLDFNEHVTKVLLSKEDGLLSIHTGRKHDFSLEENYRKTAENRQIVGFLQFSFQISVVEVRASWKRKPLT